MIQRQALKYTYMIRVTYESSQILLSVNRLLPDQMVLLVYWVLDAGIGLFWLSCLMTCVWGRWGRKELLILVDKWVIEAPGLMQLSIIIPKLVWNLAKPRHSDQCYDFCRGELQFTDNRTKTSEEVLMIGLVREDEGKECFNVKFYIFALNILLKYTWILENKKVSILKKIFFFLFYLPRVLSVEPR